MNYFGDTLSAEAAGISVSLFALNAVVCETQDKMIFVLYDRLYDFIGTHDERAKIFRFID